MPQLVRTVRGGDLGGVSAGTWWLTLANAVAWAVWAVAAQVPTAGIPSLVGGPAAAVILWKVHRGGGPGVSTEVDSPLGLPGPGGAAGGRASALPAAEAAHEGEVVLQAPRLTERVA